MLNSNINRARLLFRSRHRGTQESDLLLGSFADHCLAGLDAGQLDRFEALLDEKQFDEIVDPRKMVGRPVAAN